MSEEDGILSLRRKIAGLTASLSVSVLGYNLLENPEGFVVAALYNAALEGVARFFGEVGLLIVDVWGILTDAFVDAGGAVVAPFSTSASWILAAIGSAQSWLVEVASWAGPAAPIVALAVWAVVAIAALTIAERIVSGVAPWT